MKMDARSFLVGFFVSGVSCSLMMVILNDAIAAEVIKAHQQGKIECQTVGGEFICREVQK